MIYNKLAYAAVLSASTAFAASGGNTDSIGGTTLLANVIQKGSEIDGSTSIGAAEVGQALSATSTNNFMNFCSGQTLTNGLQITTGSCNGIPMGQLPAKTAMVSSIILNPKTGVSVPSDTTFNITVQMANLAAGQFTNADATYFSAPQTLTNGIVSGHTHVTVQDLGGSLNPSGALDATQFAFFKGINDAGNGQGLLSAIVTGGLPAGNYRVCTMASAANHQPVIMPVAQRGTADDCTKFVVSGDGTTANIASNDGSGGIAAAALAASAVAAGAGAVDTSTAVAVAASSVATSGSAASTGTASTGKGGAKAAGGAGAAKASGATTATGGKGAKAAAPPAKAPAGGKFGGKGGKQRFARRQFIA